MSSFDTSTVLVSFPTSGIPNEIRNLVLTLEGTVQPGQPNSEITGDRQRSGRAWLDPCLRVGLPDPLVQGHRVDT